MNTVLINEVSGSRQMTRPNMQPSGLLWVAAKQKVRTTPPNLNNTNFNQESIEPMKPCSMAPVVNAVRKQIRRSSVHTYPSKYFWKTPINLRLLIRPAHQEAIIVAVCMCMCVVSCTCSTRELVGVCT